MCLPLIYLIIRAFEGGWETAHTVFWQVSVWRASATSLAVAALVAVTAVVVGVPASWVVVRSNLPLRRWWVVLIVLPLAVPSFVGAYAWASLFPGFAGFWAAWIVLTAATIPYVILPTAAALRGIDPAHEEVARTLGRRPIPAFLKVALPQIWPSVGGGALLVALYVLSDFGAVSILRVDTLSRAVYASYRSSFDRTSAAMLALLLALLAVLVVAIEQRARGRAQRARIGAGAPRQLPVSNLGRWLPAAYAVLLGIVITGLVIPVGATISQLAAGTSTRLEISDLLSATATSAWYGTVGMVVAMLLALPVGLLAGRYPSPVARGLERLSFVGHALPGVVVGLSVVFVGSRLVPGLYQTVALLGFAYGILFLPKAAAAVRGSVAQVPPVLEDVARTLGDSPVRAFWRVTMRMASPGIAAGALLVLLTVMKELPATLMLRPTGADTLATRLWTFTGVGEYGAAAPYSLMLIAIGAIPAVVLAVPLVKSAAAKRSATGASGVSGNNGVSGNSGAVGNNGVSRGTGQDGSGAGRQEVGA